MEKKRILFAHSGGSQGSSGEGSFDFVNALREELGSEFEIDYPIIDNPQAPDYAMWKKLFDNAFNRAERTPVLIGHSFGGSMILKYLSEEKPSVAIPALFLVSIPYWGTEGWEVDDFVLREDFQSHLPDISKVQFFHSEDDDVVPIEHLHLYGKALKKANVKILKGQDHAFAKGLPELVEELKKL